MVDRCKQVVCSWVTAAWLNAVLSEKVENVFEWVGQPAGGLTRICNNFNYQRLDVGWYKDFHLQLNAILSGFVEICYIDPVSDRIWLHRLWTRVHFLWGSIFYGTYRIWTPIEYGPPRSKFYGGGPYFIIEYGPGVHFPWGPYSIWHRHAFILKQWKAYQAIYSCTSLHQCVYDWLLWTLTLYQGFSSGFCEFALSVAQHVSVGLKGLLSQKQLNQFPCLHNYNGLLFVHRRAVFGGNNIEVHVTPIIKLLFTQVL